MILAVFALFSMEQKVKIIIINGKTTCLVVFLFFGTLVGFCAECTMLEKTNQGFSTENLVKITINKHDTELCNELIFGSQLDIGNMIAIFSGRETGGERKRNSETAPAEILRTKR
jgi:hypothetical protein